MQLDSARPADVDQEWTLLHAGLQDPDELAEQMQQQMIKLKETIDLYMTVKRVKPNEGEINFYCGVRLYESMEELFRSF